MKKISVLHKETELQAKNKKVRLQLKGTVHPKMKILSLITPPPPRVFPNP